MDPLEEILPAVGGRQLLRACSQRSPQELVGKCLREMGESLGSADGEFPTLP
jgi:hypothetical protein